MDSKEEVQLVEEKKFSVFCGKENNEIDYKDVAKLKKYVSERGKFFLEELQETVLSTRELLQ